LDITLFSSRDAGQHVSREYQPGCFKGLCLIALSLLDISALPGERTTKIQVRRGKWMLSLASCVVWLSGICKVKPQKEVNRCFFFISATLIPPGLIILEAIYRPIEKDDRVSDLAQDVTIPVQALVRNSQLHIPGDQLKVCCI
jgi:hypothetical protein